MTCQEEVFVTFSGSVYDVLSGYTQEEKVEIAHRHLIPHQLEQHGLTPQQLQIPQDTTQDIISKYEHKHSHIRRGCFTHARRVAGQREEGSDYLSSRTEGGDYHSQTV